MASTRTHVAAITGANKGIGLAIVRNLAQSYHKSTGHPGPFQIYLTARSAERGAAAVKEVNEQLKASNVTISFHALDITSHQSVEKFHDFLKTTHPDGIDILINNAGVALDGFNADIVRQTFATNYYGTLDATQTLLPLVKNGGRVVNVSSTAGELNGYSSEIRDAFKKAAKTDIPSVTTLMEKFVKAVEEGKEKEAGYPSSAYRVSKAGETAFTKVIAMEEAKRGRGVLVNACCPGYVNTDMTKGKGTKTVEQGASTPVMLALEDIRGETGGFWREGKSVEW